MLDWLKDEEIVYQIGLYVTGIEMSLSLVILSVEYFLFMLPGFLFFHLEWMIGRVEWLRNLTGFLHAIQVSFILDLLVLFRQTTTWWDDSRYDEWAIALGILHVSFMWAMQNLDPYLNEFYKTLLMLLLSFVAIWSLC